MSPKRDRQINIRLPYDRFELLEAAAFVDSTTASALLTEIAIEAIARYETESATRAALKARRDREAEELHKVRPIGRSPKGGSSSPKRK